MEKDKEALQQAKPKHNRILLTFAIIVLAALFIVELYLMINDKNNLLFIGLDGLAMLCFVYWITDLVFKMRNERDDYYEKEYQSIYKAEKISYILMKKSFMELKKSLDEISENTEIPTDELIEAQKAVGKVTVQRNKENAATILESNEKLLQHFTVFEEKLKDMPVFQDHSEDSSAYAEVLQEVASLKDTLQGMAVFHDKLDRIIGRMETPQEDTSMQAIDELSAQQKRLMDALDMTRTSLKDDILKLKEQMASQMEAIPSVLQEVQASSALQEELELSPEELEQALGEASALMESIDIPMPDISEPEVLAKEDLPVDALPEAIFKEQASADPEPAVSDERSGAETETAPEEFAPLAFETVSEEEAAIIPEASPVLEEQTESPEPMASEVSFQEGLESFATLSEPNPAAQEELPQTPEAPMSEIAEPLEMPEAPMPEIAEPLEMPEASMPKTEAPPEASPMLKEQTEPMTLEASFQEGIESFAELSASNPVPQEELPQPPKAPMPKIEEPLQTPEAPMPKAEEPVESSVTEPVKKDETPKKAARKKAAKSTDTVTEETPKKKTSASKVSMTPGKTMTPDEIALLLGEIDAITDTWDEPDPEIEETPVTPDEPQEGQAMTPEEIAALLANL